MKHMAELGSLNLDSKGSYNKNLKKKSNTIKHK